MKYMALIALLIIGMSTNALPQSAAETTENMNPLHAENGEKMERPGKHIRQIDIKGYTLMYHILELSERSTMIETMKNHSSMGMSKSPDVTHHILVYVQNPDGKIVLCDVVLVITGPDGEVFSTMAMGMLGGYGSDVILNHKGLYTLRTKINIDYEENNITLDDEFTYEVM